MPQLTMANVVRIRDLGSKNRTIIEGVALEPGVDHDLGDGNIAQLGRSLLTW